ncbi:MAG: pyridoxal-phosphate dependent enzyme, partial [Gemmatimonadaceae bacterium]
GVHWVPFGGTSPLGALGHVNAALELAAQVRAGLLPAPARVVVPLGTGGTAAGLALGFRIAGLSLVLECARVGPRIATHRTWVLRLARKTAALIERVTGERLPAVPAGMVRVTHDVYGGAYGRPFPAGTAAAAQLEQAIGARLDATYSAKALAAAVMRMEERTLFWLTFDGRWIEREKV